MARKEHLTIKVVKDDAPYLYTVTDLHKLDLLVYQTIASGVKILFYLKHKKFH